MGLDRRTINTYFVRAREKLGLYNRDQLLAYARAHGEIEAADRVLHRCDNPPCVNPGHLFIGTAADNTADMVSKGRQHRGSTHHRAKLTDTDVKEIRKILTSSSRSDIEIAKQFHVSPAAIWFIRTGKGWKHVK